MNDTPNAPDPAAEAKSLKTKQRHRFQRFLMAMVSSLLVLALMYLLAWRGMMDEAGFMYTAAAMLSCFALFIALFLTGLNLKAADPSLTGGQMACSMLVLSVAMFYSDSDGRGLLLMIFLVSFIFGVLRLQVRELFYSGLIASLLYAAVIVLLMVRRPASLDPQLELMRWLVMTLVLAWFSLIGGHISRVRKQLSDNNLELGKALQTIQDLATHDALTGLHNRRYLEQALRHECAQSERSGRAFCICIADIDLFKSINDTYGHQAGDEALQGLAASTVRIVRRADHFGRYGGEEFLGILTGTDLAGAHVWAENLRKQTESIVFPGLPAGFRVTVSIGIAQYQPGEDIDRTVSRADRALYQAKSAGRNRVISLESA